MGAIIPMCLGTTRIRQSPSNTTVYYYYYYYYLDWQHVSTSQGRRHNEGLMMTL